MWIIFNLFDFPIFFCLIFFCEYFSLSFKKMRMFCKLNEIKDDRRLSWQQWHWRNPWNAIMKAHFSLCAASKGHEWDEWKLHASKSSKNFFVITFLCVCVCWTTPKRFLFFAIFCAFTLAIKVNWWKGFWIYYSWISFAWSLNEWS